MISKSVPDLTFRAWPFARVPQNLLAEPDIADVQHLGLKASSYSARESGICPFSTSWCGVFAPQAFAPKLFTTTRMASVPKCRYCLECAVTGAKLPNIGLLIGINCVAPSP
jgi:hypothetical protein